MNQLKIIHDTGGKTLTIWFDEPKHEAVAEEIGQDIVVMKDKSGTVIGYEKLNYISSDQELPIEIVSN